MLKKNMLQREINKQLLAYGYTLKIFDEIYFGDKHPHDWICKCNNIITNKKFRDIRKNKNIICNECTYLEVENNYKITVENVPGYTYIRSYRSGEIVITEKKVIQVKDSPYLEIKHNPCGRLYTITYGGFKQGKRCPCSKYKDSVKCLYPEISDLIYLDENKSLVEESLKATIHANSGKKFYFKCGKCGEVSDKCLTLAAIVKKGYSCKYCSDGISIPEKFLINLLTEMKIPFKFHKSFSWSDNKIYDFYIPSINLLIETHGIQHYEESPRSTRTLEEEVANDKKKHELALENKKNI